MQYRLQLNEEFGALKYFRGDLSELLLEHIMRKKINNS